MEHIEPAVVKWHEDRNLIDGATDWSQTDKLFEEFIELVAAQMPDRNPTAIVLKVKQMLYRLHSANRIKAVSSFDAQDAKLDALGDMVVVQMNIAKRNDTTLVQCTRDAYSVIKDRKGRMIDGNFVKEEDLPECQNSI